MCPNMHFGILMEIEKEYDKNFLASTLNRMAAIREAKEETGLDVEEEKLIGIDACVYSLEMHLVR